MASNVQLLRTGALLSRVATLGGALAIEVTPLLEALTLLELDLGAWARVAVSDDFRRLAVTGRLPGGPESAEAYARLLEVIAGIDALQADRLAELEPGATEAETEADSDRRAGDGDEGERDGERVGERDNADDSALLVELGASHGSDRLSASITWPRIRPLAEVAQQVARAAAVPAAAAHRFGAAVASLGRAADAPSQASGWSDNFRAPAHHSFSLQVLADGDRPLVALAETARLVGVAPPQLRLLDELHAVLSRRGPALASLRVGPGVLFPELGVAFPAVAMEAVIRVLRGIHHAHQGPSPEDTARHVGALAGALDADDASRFEITFREGVPSARIVVDCDDAAESTASSDA